MKHKSARAAPTSPVSGVEHRPPLPLSRSHPIPHHLVPLPTCNERGHSRGSIFLTAYPLAHCPLLSSDMLAYVQQPAPYFLRAVHITSADGPGTIYFGTTCWVGCPSEARRMVEQERSPVASTAPRIRYVLESNMLPVFHIYPWSFSSDAASLDRGRRARLRTRTR